VPENDNDGSGVEYEEVEFEEVDPTDDSVPPCMVGFLIDIEVC
jgi:hypothetical protein